MYRVDRFEQVDMMRTMMKRNIVRLLRLGLIMAAMAFGLLAEPAFAQEANPEVVILEASGPVAPPFASYIKRGIDEADRQNAEAVILVIDTPGGSLDSTTEIIQVIRNSDVPVIVFVGPRGAQSASAGLLITLAGHASAMAPDTAIGATSPISLQGEDLDSVSQEKTEQYIAAEARSLAENRSKEAQTIAEEAVFEARAVSAREAYESGLVDFIAEDVDDLLEQLDGFEVEVNGRSLVLNTTNASTTTLPMNLLERILLVITDPNIVFILLSIGVTAIIIEIRSPGGWLAGVVGITLFGLALYGLGVLPVNWLGIVFVIMAFVLFVLEIKAPVHGAMVTIGIISLGVGAIILFNQPAIAPYGRLSIPLVIGQSLLLGAIFAFLVVMALRAQKLRPTTGYEGLIGKTGRVTETLDPVGMVQVWGERWSAESVSGEPIEKGQEIEVLEAGNMRVKVQVKGRRQDSGGE
jgi:membrane-bound serine protease (ClpP class)